MSRMVLTCLEAAEQLAAEGVEAEVIDLRSLSPWDEEAILESVAKTGRLVVVDEDNPRCGMAADVAALAASRALHYLDAPVRMVTAPHTPVPFSPVLEDHYVPDARRVIEAVRSTLGQEAGASRQELRA